MSDKKRQRHSQSTFSLAVKGLLGQPFLPPPPLSPPPCRSSYTEMQLQLIVGLNENKEQPFEKKFFFNVSKEKTFGAPALKATEQTLTASWRT